MKDKSSTSFPLISRQTELKENDSCFFSKSSGQASRKKSLLVLGLRIAHWARRILSVTSGLSKMGSPNLISLGWANSTPLPSLTIRSETTQHQGSFERLSWHSVGHLRMANEYHGENIRVEDDVYLPRTGTSSARQRDARDGLYE
jgi:hypothetical protein